jgi:NAD(P)-dependent dehydrogenase (short-subunit alcohol dehydrogenase family)
MGLGAAMAVDLAQHGAHVVISARHHGAEADRVLASIRELGRRAEFVGADCGVPADCTRCVEEAVAKFGHLDVLILNAGSPSPGKIDEVTAEQWLQTMNVHVNAIFFMVKAALPSLRRQTEGAVITVSSAAGIRGVPGAIAYATAKGAVAQFTRALARDLADDNIRVNCIAPGVIRTRFHDDMTPERKKINLEQRIPLHREGTAEQVAQAVRLLLTNDYITGEILVIDGGLTMRIA